jgi:hypothetical protein
MGINFSYINYLNDARNMSVSSEDPAFPFTNVLNPFRSLPWRTQSGQITNQYIQFDCGYQIQPKSFYLCNEQRGIQLSPQAEIRIIGCNDGNWSTPEANILVPWDEKLISYASDTAFAPCRFWRITINDPNNIDNYLEIGNLHLGQSITFTSTDLNLGWSDAIIDDSEKVLSDGNEAWFDQKTQRAKYTFQLQYMGYDEMLQLKDFFSLVGQHVPFYLTLDPDLKISTTLSELAIYCRFTGELEFTNPFYKLYTVNLTVEEVV